MERFILRTAHLSTLVGAIAWAGTAHATSPIEGLLQSQSATPPQQSIADVIEDICPPGDLLVQDLQDRCNEIAVGIISGQDVSGGQAGLQGMAPEENSVVARTNVDISNAQFNAVGARLSALRAGAVGVQVLGFNLDGRPAARDELYSGLDGAATGGGASADEYGFGRWGMFINGNFGIGDKDETLRESGFDYTIFGVTAGVDYRLSDQAVIGAAFSYNNTDAELFNNGGSLDSNSYAGSLYASYFPNENLYFDGIISGGFSDYDQKRAVRYSIASLGGGTTTVDQVASASMDGDHFSVAFGSGYTFYREAWSFGPYGRLQYLTASVDGFRETMSNPGAAGSGLGLDIDDQDYDSLTLTFGGMISKAISTNWGVLIPQANVEYVHEFMNDDNRISGRFLGDGTATTFVLEGDDPDRDYVIVGFGFSGIFAGGRTAFVQYQGLLGYSNLESHALTAGVRWEF